MYYPYMRGKQYELIVLRELLEEGIVDGKMIPIIEPINITGNTHVKSYSDINESNKPIILICNPLEGNVPSNDVKVNLFETLFEDNIEVIVGILISSNSTLGEIEDLIDTYDDYNVALIHYEEFISPNDLNGAISDKKNVQLHIHNGMNRASYQLLFNDYTRVLLEDGFVKARRNQDYPEETIFSNLFDTYSPEYEGFGDFLIVGREYIEGGWTPNAVTIHFTHKNRQKIIATKHFVSNTITDDLDIAGKYGEAHAKLVDFLDKNPEFNNTMASQELYNMTESRGLGYLKKVSMRHHIELICNLI